MMRIIVGKYMDKISDCNVAMDNGVMGGIAIID